MCGGMFLTTYYIADIVSFKVRSLYLREDRSLMNKILKREGCLSKHRDKKSTALSRNPIPVVQRVAINIWAPQLKVEAGICIH
jgi:hypothetical protein